MSDIDAASASFAEETKEITHEQLVDKLHSEIMNKNNLFETIKKKIIEFLQANEEFERTNGKEGTIGQVLHNLEQKKEVIYSKFFEIQNLINLYCNQKVVMTYVHIDENGQREIRISDNDISHLGISYGASWNGNPFYKLSYDVSNHYDTLKNSLPPEANASLQETAMEVTRRYNTYKKRVMWYYPAEWKGYTLSNMGPINESFVNMYVHNIKLVNSLEGNIDTFMLGDHGAINADGTRGFLIGDVSKDGIQYAVKGQFGSPQGTKEIIKAFQKMADEDFSIDSFYDFLYKFIDEEMDKKYKPHIRENTARSLKSFVNYHKGEMEKIKLQASI